MFLGSAPRSLQQPLAALSVAVSWLGWGGDRGWWLQGGSQFGCWVTCKPGTSGESLGLCHTHKGTTFALSSQKGDVLGTDPAAGTLGGRILRSQNTGDNSRRSKSSSLKLRGRSLSKGSPGVAPRCAGDSPPSCSAVPLTFTLILLHFPEDSLFSKLFLDGSTPTPWVTSLFNREQLYQTLQVCLASTNPLLRAQQQPGPAGSAQVHSTAPI